MLAWAVVPAVLVLPAWETPPARAEEPPAGTPANEGDEFVDRLLARTLHNEAHVPEDAELTLQLAELAHRPLASRDLDLLAECLAPPKAELLVRVDPEDPQWAEGAATYHPAATVAARLLRAAPAALTAALRRRHGAALAAVPAGASPAEAARAARRFPLAPQAGATLARAALAALEQGAWSTAFSWWLEVFRDAPQTFLGRWDWLAAFVLAAEREGAADLLRRELLPFARARFADVTLREGERELGLVAWLEARLAQAPPEPAWTDGAWTGEDVRRARLEAAAEFTRLAAPAGSEPSAALAWHWRYRQFEYAADATAEREAGAPPRLAFRPAQTEGARPFSPVLPVHDGRALYAVSSPWGAALDVAGGALEWLIEDPRGAVGDGPPPWRPGETFAGQAAPYRLVLDGPVLYGQLDHPPVVGTADRGGPPIVMGWDRRREGAVCFSHLPQPRPLLRERDAAGLDRRSEDARDDDEELARLVISSSFAVSAGRLYVGAVERRGPGQLVYLLCFDLQDRGRLRWRRYVCMENRTGGRFGGSSPVAVESAVLHHGGRVLLATHFGVVAALDPDDGRPIWVARYARPARDNPTGRFVDSGAAPGYWPHAPLLAEGGLVTVAPVDSDHLFVFDAADGRLVRHWPPLDFQHVRPGEYRFLLGSAGGRLYVASNTRLARFRAGWDPAGDDFRSIALPAGAAPAGRALIGPAHLYLPTSRGLLVVALARAFGPADSAGLAPDAEALTLIELPIPDAPGPPPPATAPPAVVAPRREIILQGGGQLVVRRGPLPAGGPGAVVARPADDATPEVGPFAGNLSMARIVGPDGSARRLLIVAGWDRMAAYWVE